jgi:nicotinamidase-related amidase
MRMTANPWDSFLTEQDRKVMAASGFGARAGFGERPALLVIDVNYAFVGDRSEPIVESMRKWKTSCGEIGWRAIPTIRKLIDTAHAKGLPVIYTTGERRPDQWDAGSWAWKSSSHVGAAPNARPNVDGNMIVPDIAPSPKDIVIRKLKPSAFFGTPLLSFLVDLKVDSLIVTGTTTSGCVRASVVDAFSNNYRCALVSDASFDRFEMSHAVSLFDMGAKYADIVDSEEALTFMAGLESNLFKLPSGNPPGA